METYFSTIGKSIFQKILSEKVISLKKSGFKIFKVLSRVVRFGLVLFDVNRFPVGKISNRNSLSECVFVNSALKRQCYVVKNSLLKTTFSAFLPTGV